MQYLCFANVCVFLLYDRLSLYAVCAQQFFLSISDIKILACPFPPSCTNLVFSLSFSQNQSESEIRSGRSGGAASLQLKNPTLKQWQRVSNIEMRLNPDHQAHGQQFIEKSQKVWSHSLITVFGCVRIYPEGMWGLSRTYILYFSLKRPFVLPLLKSWLNYRPFNSISINISEHRYRMTIIGLSCKNTLHYDFLL